MGGPHSSPAQEVSPLLAARLRLQILEDIKVGVASVLGVGNWFLTDLDLMLKCLVSLATLIYIVMRILRLNKRG